MIINISGIVQNMQGVALGMLWVKKNNPFSGVKVEACTRGPGLSRKGSVRNLNM